MKSTELDLKLDAVQCQMTVVVEAAAPAPGLSGAETQGESAPSGPERYGLSPDRRSTDDFYKQDRAGGAGTWTAGGKGGRLAQESATGKGGGMLPTSRSDQEKMTNIYERKMFDKRVSKLSGDKTEKGEKEFKAWLFDVRKVTAEDLPFHSFLDWIADLEVEVTMDEIEKKQRASSFWPMEWLNKQLYGILSETCVGKLKETVMKREREVGINGIKIFRDLCRDYLDASKEGKVALGQRIVKPARADMDSFEDRLRAWEEDVERLNRITEKDVDDSLKPVYL